LISELNNLHNGKDKDGNHISISSALQLQHVWKLCSKTTRVRPAVQIAWTTALAKKKDMTIIGSPSEALWQLVILAF